MVWHKVCRLQPVLRMCLLLVCCVCQVCWQLPNGLRHHPQNVVGTQLPQPLCCCHCSFAYGVYLSLPGFSCTPVPACSSKPYLIFHYPCHTRTPPSAHLLVMLIEPCRSIHAHTHYTYTCTHRHTDTYAGTHTHTHTHTLQPHLLVMLLEPCWSTHSHAHTRKL
jgi:hypothetical protein